MRLVGEVSDDLIFLVKGDRAKSDIPSARGMQLATSQRPQPPPVPPRPSRQVVAEALKRTVRPPCPTRQAPPPPNTRPWRIDAREKNPPAGRTVVYESGKERQTNGGNRSPKESPRPNSRYDKTYDLTGNTAPAASAAAAAAASAAAAAEKTEERGLTPTTSERNEAQRERQQQQQSLLRREPCDRGNSTIQQEDSEIPTKANRRFADNEPQQDSSTTTLNAREKDTKDRILEEGKLVDRLRFKDPEIEKRSNYDINQSQQVGSENFRSSFDAESTESENNSNDDKVAQFSPDQNPETNPVDLFDVTQSGSNTTISSDDCATVVVVDEPERKSSTPNEDSDNIHHQDWLEAGIRYSSTNITIPAGDDPTDNPEFCPINDQRHCQDDDEEYEEDCRTYVKLDHFSIHERIAMSSLQGLPPLPRSLSGFNLSDGRREVTEPPPPPTRSSSKTQKNVKSTHPSSSRPSPPGRQLTTLDTQLAILRKEMFGLRQLDLSLLSQLWSLNESIQEFRQLLQEQEDRAPSPSPSSEEGDDNSYGSHPPPPPRRPAPLLHHHRPPRPPRPLRPPASDESPSSEEYGAV